ncbi:MAG: flagellar hook assembly protein FlgD [Acetanaerobacterium sp.]
MDGISGYNSQYSSASDKRMYTTESGHEYWLATEDNSSLDIQDFFSLIASQLSNQDFMNPTDNTEFMAQLAQFTALQMQESILYSSNASFASSLVGKTVVAAKVDSEGNVVSTTGVVERIAFSSGGYEYYVDGEKFSLENLMEIHATDPADESDEPDDPEDPEDVEDSEDPVDSAEGTTGDES